MNSMILGTLQQTYLLSRWTEKMLMFMAHLNHIRFEQCTICYIML